MTKATPKKKTTTTKKKPTVKAHRGFAHVPLRGRRRPVGDPPRRRVQKSYKDMTPAERAARRRQIELGRKRFLQGRGPLDNPRMTPAQRDALRRQRQLALRRQRQLSRMSPQERMRFMMERDLRARGVGRGRQLTPAQRDRMRRQLEDAAKRQLDKPVLPIRRRPTVERLRAAQNQAFKDAQSRKKRRPHGDPKPRRRVTPAKKQVKQATQAPRTRPKSRRV